MNGIGEINREDEVKKKSSRLKLSPKGAIIAAVIVVLAALAVFQIVRSSAVLNKVSEKQLVSDMVGYHMSENLQWLYLTVNINDRHDLDIIADDEQASFENCWESYAEGKTQHFLAPLMMAYEYNYISPEDVYNYPDAVQWLEDYAQLGLNVNMTQEKFDSDYYTLIAGGFLNQVQQAAQQDPDFSSILAYIQYAVGNGTAPEIRQY